MVSPSEVLTQAMKLSTKDRAAIAHQLLLSLEPEDSSDEAVTNAWQQEVNERLQKIADGTFTAHDWRSTICEIRRELKKESES